MPRLEAYRSPLREVDESCMTVDEWSTDAVYDQAERLQCNQNNISELHLCILLSRAP